MTSTELEQLAALIRDAKYPVMVGPSGIPAAVEDEAWPERMDLFAALTEGYNTALQLLAASRSDVERLEKRLALRDRIEKAFKKGE